MTYKLPHYHLGGLRLSISSYVDQGLTDREMFDAAIADALDDSYTEIEIPSGDYDLGAGYLRYGTKRITWVASPDTTFDAAAKLNAPLIVGPNVYNPGMFGDYEDTCRIAKIGGGAILNSRQNGITGYTTTEEAAYFHERGRAADFVQVSDGGQINVPAVDTSFTATTLELTTSLDTNTFRVGMLIDVVGTTRYVGDTSTCRYVGKIVDWAEDGTSITVDGWWREADNTQTSAVQETPPDNRACVINPVNKVWGANMNLFLQRSDGDTYGHTSGSWYELAVGNFTGEDLGEEFDQNTHPLHFYGLDLSHIGNHGGGNALTVRGKVDQRWTNAMMIFDADRGLYMPDKEGNVGGHAVVTRHDGVNGPDSVFLAEYKDSSPLPATYRRMAQLEADQPIFHLGKSDDASTPEIRFDSSGNTNAYDTRIYATGGTASAAQGTLVIDASVLRFVNALPTTAPTASNALWSNGDGIVRITP